MLRGRDRGTRQRLCAANQLRHRRPGDEDLLAKRQASIAAAVRRDPKDAAALAARARLLLEAGKLDEYRTTRAALFDLAAEFKDKSLARRLAALCVTAPGPEDPVPLLDAFKKTMSGKHPEDLRLHGGLLLRAGKAEEAVKQLEAARTALGVGDGGPPPDTPFEDLLLALAHHKLAAGSGDSRQAQEARECLQRARSALDRHRQTITASAAVLGAYVAAMQPYNGPGPLERTVGWQGWIDLQILRREAEAALLK